MAIPPALKTVELLAGLSPAQIEAIAAVGEIGIYHKGDVIVRKGDRSTNLYFVLSGQVEVISEIDENQTSLLLLGAGQSFGEMSLLDAGPRSATIRCISQSAEIMTFTREALLALWDRECRVGYKMMENIARDLAFKLRIRNITSVMAGEGVR